MLSDGLAVLGFSWVSSILRIDTWFEILNESNSKIIYTSSNYSNYYSLQHPNIWITANIKKNINKNIVTVSHFTDARDRYFNSNLFLE